MAAAAKAAASRPLEQSELAGIAQAQRDQGFKLFHVLGKFLYNKRDGAAGGGGDGDADDDDECDGEGGTRGALQTQWGTSSGGRRRGSSGNKSAPARARQRALEEVAAQQHRVCGPDQWMEAVSRATAGLQLPERYHRSLSA